MTSRIGRWTGVTLAGLALLVTGPAARGEENGGRELIRKALEALPKQTFVAKLTLSSSDSGMRKLELRHKFISGARASYLEVTAPAELEGIRFLFLEHVGKPHEQYIKVTASRIPVQVADQIRKQPFLGSSFYVSDLVEPELDAYTYKLTGDDEVSGRKCKLVESTPKNAEEALYGKTMACIDPADLLVMRREFFDHKGRLLKVWTVEQVDKVDGIWTIRKQLMANAQEQTQSRLVLDEIQYNVELPDSMFSPSYLGR